MATVDYTALLNRAVTEKGIINAAYSAFYNYSIGNQMLAADQLIGRGLNLTPIASYKSWLDKNRQVKKGEKAIALYMPIQMKSKDKSEDAKDLDDKGTGAKRTVLMLRNNWFSYEQTEGEEYMPEVKIPTWDAKLAMEKLNIEEVPFSLVRGNVLGYAVGRQIAINPMNNFKHKTRFHELCHCILHTGESEFSEMEVLPRDIKEAEAEGVAFILTSLLGLDGQAESRAYIQTWLDGKEMPEESARRIFTTANKIMEAGQPCAI